MSKFFSKDKVPFAAFTLNGFDDLERNLTIEALRSVPGCQTYMCKLGISFGGGDFYPSDVTSSFKVMQVEAGM